MAVVENIVDPGMVNIEDQAYPFPIPPFQDEPFNDGELTPGSLYAPPIVPPDFSSLKPFLNMAVESQVYPSPALFMATQAPFRENIDVSLQSFANLDIREFIVTEAGNFQTNAPGLPDFVDLQILEIKDAQTLGSVSAGTTRYRIALSASLVPFGVPIQDREVEVIAAFTAANVGQVRTIRFWNVNLIYIDRAEGDENFAVDLAVGDTLRFEVDREGFEVVNDIFPNDINVFLADSFVAPPNDPVNAEFGIFEGNATPTDGVIIPFVGSGIIAPPFLGTFQVAVQTYGTGLPKDVFV